MTEVRQDSSQQNESCRWIRNFVEVILAALLLFVLFKELHSLSKDMDESRKLLKKLSGRLTKAEKENENLRKELGRTKAKMDRMLQVFSDMQKISRVRRSHKDGHNGSANKCNKLQHCMERFHKDDNCTLIKKCMPSRRKEFFHAFILKAFEKRDVKQLRAQLLWNDDFTSDMTVIQSRTEIIISTSGVYYVYCRLRVSRRITRALIWKDNSVLFSSWPTFAGGNNYGVVHMFGLAKIPSATKLYVQVEFKGMTNLNGTVEGMSALFPKYEADKGVEYDNDYPYNASSLPYKVPDRNINSFGAFQVS
ncbi:hypothetical protein ACROYT_G027000 [Oculina patagonica]